MLLSLVIIISLLNILLGSSAYIRNRKSSNYIVYFIFSIFTAFWIVSNYYTDFASTFEIKYFANKIAFFSAHISVVLIWGFSKLFIDGVLSRLERILIFLSFFINGLIIFSGIVIQGATVDDTGFHPRLSSWYILYIGSLIIFLGFYFKNLIIGYRNAVGKDYFYKKSQIRYILYGSLIFAFFQL